MQRIHAPFDEPTLAQIDNEVKMKGISRAQWLSTAASAYLRLSELSNGADPEDMILELAQIKGMPLADIEKMSANMSLLERDLAHCRDTINQKDQQITFLHGHVSQLTQSISQLALPQMTEEERKKSWWQFWK